MAANAEAYKGVAGDTGLLAAAAVRSGEYGEGGGASASAAYGSPPPPPPPAEPPLPADWTKVKDEDSGDYYFFNTKTGASVWDRAEVR